MGVAVSATVGVAVSSIVAVAEGVAVAMATAGIVVEGLGWVTTIGRAAVGVALCCWEGGAELSPAIMSVAPTAILSSAPSATRAARLPDWLLNSTAVLCRSALTA